MTDIELVIKIPERIHYGIEKGITVNGSDASQILIDAVKNGTPLPKGHGRIMDADKIIKKMEEREERLKDDKSIWETAGVETAIDMFGEIIIEADNEVEK